jgi:hypothetical protein
MMSRARQLVAAAVLSSCLAATGSTAAGAQDVIPSDAQVLMPSDAGPSVAVCSDDIGNGVNIGVWRLGAARGDGATAIKLLCDDLVSQGTANPDPEGLAITECDVLLGDGPLFLHVTVSDDGSRLAASEACLRLNNQPFPTHLYWGR